MSDGTSSFVVVEQVFRVRKESLTRNKDQTITCQIKKQ